MSFKNENELKIFSGKGNIRIHHQKTYTVKNKIPNEISEEVGLYIFTDFIFYIQQHNMK